MVPLKITIDNFINHIQNKYKQKLRHNLITIILNCLQQRDFY